MLQCKVDEKGTSSVKKGIQIGQRLGLGAEPPRPSPYKTFLSNPPPPPLDIGLCFMAKISVSCGTQVVLRSILKKTEFKMNLKLLTTSRAIGTAN